jgi:outer membrane protein assembly factor BamA
MPIETNVDVDFKYFAPSIKPSVSRIFFRRLFLKLGYKFEYFWLYQMTSAFERELKNKIPDMENPLRTGELEASTRLMLTDQLIYPNNGVVLKFSYWFAGKYLGSAVNYNKINPSISMYWRMISWLQLAIRTELGLIFPYAGTSFTGFRTNFYLGGFNTMRAWGGKKLSPWIWICVDGDKDCERVHTGGRTMVLGNIEFRFRINRYIGIVTFLDVGDVQYDTLKFEPSLWNYSAGSGLRLKTPIGKFRIDLGYRINNPSNYEHEDRFGLHIGLGEAF